MTRAWMLALFTGATTMAIKAVGALVPAGNESSALARAIGRLTPLLLPGVLTALIVVQAFSDGQRLVLDARAIGVLVAIIAVRFRAPPAITLVSAAVATAAARLIYAYAIGGAI